MTPGSYADAAGLVERSAAAYAAAVPVTPQDDGFFGPASVAWRVSTDLAAPVAGLRSLLIQALHALEHLEQVVQHVGGVVHREVTQDLLVVGTDLRQRLHLP